MTSEKKLKGSVIKDAISVLDYEFKEVIERKVRMDESTGTKDTMIKTTSMVSGTVVIKLVEERRRDGEDGVLNVLLRSGVTVNRLDFALPDSNACTTIGYNGGIITVRNGRVRGQRPDLERGTVEYTIEGTEMEVNVAVTRKMRWG